MEEGPAGEEGSVNQRGPLLYGFSRTPADVNVVVVIVNPQERLTRLYCRYNMSTVTLHVHTYHCLWY